MKKPFLTIALLVLLGLGTQTVFGQACYGGSCYGGSGAPANELGIRLAGLTNSSMAGGRFTPNKGLHLGFLSGIHYKRYQTVGAVRAQVGYAGYDVDETTDCPDCIRTDGRVDQWNFKLGYEFFTFFGPLEPYAGFDAVLSLGKYEGETFTYGSNQQDFREYTEVRNKRGFGFAPVVGLRCYIGPFISIGAESTFEAMLYNRQTLISDFNTERPTINQQNNYYETTLHPVSWLSLNVLF